MSDSSTARFELRPMGIGDILDTTFRLYRMNFVPFMTTSLIVFVPYAVLMLFIKIGMAPTIIETEDGPMQQESIGASLVFFLGMVLTALIVRPLVMGALTYQISAAYLGEQLSAVDSFRLASKRILSLLGTQILSGIVIFLGLLLLIVPGIIFSLWFLVLTPVVFLDLLGGTKALSRSKELMKGNLGKGFLLSLILQLLGFVVGFVVVLPFTLIGTLSNPIWNGLPETAAEAILLPFVTAPFTLLYYDLRIRKEAFDLERLSASMAAPSVTP